MADYSLVIDSKFEPFSFDELLKPYLIRTEAYDKAEKEYSDLATQTEAFRDVANQDINPESFKMFNKYNDDLAAATSALATGDYRSAKGQLMGLKRRYASEIMPIAKAEEALNKVKETRLKLGPDAIYRNNNINSIDTFLHGNQVDETYISSSDLTKKTAAAAEAAMNELSQDPEFKKFMNDTAYLVTQHTGASYDDYMNALSSNPRAGNKLAEIKKKMMEDAGYNEFDKEGQAKIEAAINAGLYAGLDKPARQIKDNADHMTPYQSANLQMSREEHNAKMQDRQPIYIKGSEDSDGYWLDPVTGLPFKKKDESKGTEPSNRTYTAGTKPSTSSGAGRTNSKSWGLPTNKALIFIDTGKKNKDGTTKYTRQEVSRGGVNSTFDPGNGHTISWTKLPKFVQDSIKESYSTSKPEEYTFITDDEGHYYVTRNEDKVVNNTGGDPNAL